MKRQYNLYLKDILDSIEKVERYVEGKDLEGFKDSPMVIDAVLRNFEVMGEAVSQTPSEVKEGLNYSSFRSFATSS